MPAIVRDERADDAMAIGLVHQAAFPTSAEAGLVEQLRRKGRLLYSTVAVCDSRIVGHVAFSPITIGEVEAGVGLAPVGVLPEWQNRVIGGQLIRAGLESCRASGTGLVVVLGDPRYYMRFGFLPASRWNLRDEYGGGEAFQALELAPRAVPVDGGLVRYSAEFASFANDGSVHD